MGCVKASGAPDSSRRQPETAHESCGVFVYSTLRARSTKKLAKSVFKTFHFTRGSVVHTAMATSPMKNTTRLLFSRRMTYLLTLLGPQSRFGDKLPRILRGLSPKRDCGPKGCCRRCCGYQNRVPRYQVVSSSAQKKAKKGGKAL